MENYLPKAIAYIDEWLEHQHLQNKARVPGFSVAIVKDGQTLYKTARGLANVARDEPMTPEHRFRIASHSKTFTAVAVMQLVDTGKVRLDDAAANYLPFLKDCADERYGRITVRQLLSHSAGVIRDGSDASFWSLEAPFPVRDKLFALLKETPLIFEHNTRFKYSNVGYALLGLLIEAVSGQGYADYMRAHIIEPLGLDGIGAEFDPEDGPYATGYSGLFPGDRRVAFPTGTVTGDMAGATGFFAKAESVCRFYDAVMPGSGKLLSDDAKKEMLRPQWEMTDVKPSGNYGLGFVSYREGRRTLYGHSGGFPGNLTKSCFDLDEKITVSVLTNSLVARTVLLQEGIWHIFDFFKGAEEPQGELGRYEESFHSLWFAQRFVSAGSRLHVSGLDLAKPFEDCAELERDEGDSFRIIKDSGVSIPGEKAVFCFEGDRPVHVSYGGHSLWSRDQIGGRLDALDRKAGG
ncbi:MAG: class A beta-lactamase-related serine hydrolase [Alphaproteobacteria bacterium]|nr:class A beta-lactamase-related serine hydrolase [Alphaproteobacteria bacterium]